VSATITGGSPKPGKFVPGADVNNLRLANIRLVYIQCGLDSWSDEVNVE
jgi:hypothetical protein